MEAAALYSIVAAVVWLAVEVGSVVQKLDDILKEMKKRKKED